MSATSQGAACGVVLGIASVLLAQQLAYLSLSGLVPAIEYLVIGGVIGGIVFAGIGWALGRRYLSKHPPVESSEPPSSSPPA
jgi:uncharacterized protein (DUF697 family)